MGCKNNEKRSQNAFSYGFDFNLSGKPSNEIYGSKFQPYVYTLQLKSRETHFDIFHAKTIKSLMLFCWKDQHMASMKLKVFVHELDHKIYNSINHDTGL